MRCHAVGHEVGYLAVAVACDVLQCGVARGAFVEPLYGHDGENLVDCPCVGERLEEREIAEILVGKCLVEVLELFGRVLKRLGHAVHLAAYAPVHALYLGPRAQVNDAVREKVERFLAYLFGVVPVFEHGAGVEVVPDFVEVFHELVVGFGRNEFLAHLGQRRCFEHVDDEHGVVRAERASAFGDDVGVGYAVLVGGIDECVDAVVHILLYGVVHRALARRRPCAVVVHSQSSSAVNEVDVVAHPVQLYVEVGGLAQGGLYAAYLGYLRTYVEMYEPHAVVQSFLVEYFERVEQFRRCKAELACVAAALLPLARTARREFYAYAYVGPHAQFLGRRGYEVYLVHLLHDDEYAFSHFLGEQRELYVALVFVAVAHYYRVALALHGNHGVQFGLGSAFESEVELASVRDYLLHHGLHLVHLYGIDDEVLALVVVFLGRFLEAA